MNMTITESDKTLLSYLAAFIIAIAFIFLVFMPLSNKNGKLEREISEAKQQERSMDKSVAQAEDMSAAEQVLREEFSQAVQRFYPMLQSQEAENMITTLMLNHGLQIQDLSITMPEKSSNLQWYQYSANVQPQVPDEESDENEAAGLDDFGVYTIRIVCSADGEKDDMLALVDDISGNYPAISILYAEWFAAEENVADIVSAEDTSEEADEDSDADQEEDEPAEDVMPAAIVKSTGSMTITFEIYMCSQ